MKRMNSFYKSLLLLSLAVMPSAALAGEAVIGGTKKVIDVPINTVSPTWTDLVTTLVLLPADTNFDCEVTCTSTVNNPLFFASDEDYFYAAANGANPTVANGCVRQFDFPQFDLLNINDVSDKLVVASTCFITDLINDQLFRCLGARASAGDIPTVVDSTSMHVICIEDQG